MHNLCIRRSRFGRFCTISAFDSRVLAAFPLSSFSHPTPAPRSRICSHFCSFRALAAFNGRILAGPAQSLHLMVVFWQVLHNLCIRRSRFGSFSSLLILPPHTCPPFSHTIAFLQLSLTRRIQWSHFGRFCPISTFDGRVLAGFAQSLHLTVAFWQLFLFPHSRTPHLPPVLAYARIFAAFAHSLHSTFPFWQVLPNLCIRRSRFGRFCTISAFDSHVLAAFPLSTFSHPTPTPRSRIRSHFCSFRSLAAFNGHILAGFAKSLHSMVVFWQVLHNYLCIRRSRFGIFSSLPILLPCTCPPVLAYDRIFAAFAHFQNLTVTF